MLHLGHMLWKPHFLGTVQAPQGDHSLPLFPNSQHADGELLRPITSVVSDNDLNQGLLTQFRAPLIKKYIYEIYVCIYMCIYM